MILLAYILTIGALATFTFCKSGVYIQSAHILTSRVTFKAIHRKNR